jgi:hypothetical protein
VRQYNIAYAELFDKLRGDDQSTLDQSLFDVTTMKNITNVLFFIGVAIGVCYEYKWLTGANFVEVKQVPVLVRSVEDEQSRPVVLMAARFYQYSNENVSIGHGYFTKFLADGLQGGAGQYDPDMSIVLLSD